MHADYSVELGAEDPVLEIPWHSDDATVRYYDLKGRPDLVHSLPEARDNPELAAFLSRINAAGFSLQTAKCDAWCSHEMSAEEEIFGATCKFTSYIDLLFAGEVPRSSFAQHEALAKNLCDLLHHVPEMAATVELIIRRCLYHQAGASDLRIDARKTSTDFPEATTSGFYITAYVSGFGDDEKNARKQWSIALKLLQHALVQVANG